MARSTCGAAFEIESIHSEGCDKYNHEDLCIFHDTNLKRILLIHINYILVGVFSRASLLKMLSMSSDIGFPNLTFYSASRNGNYFKEFSTTLAGMHTQKLEKYHSQELVELRYPVKFDHERYCDNAPSETSISQIFPLKKFEHKLRILSK